MAQFIIRRVLSMIPVLLIVSMIAFSLILLTGDPVKAMLGQETDLETIEAMRHKLGLDQPIPVQYGKWLWNVLHGDLGYSVRSHQSVSEAIIQRLPVTLWVNLLAFLITIFLGIPAGIFAALKRNSIIDLGASFIAILGVTTPNFFLAIMLIYLFSIKLNWIPPSGFINPLEHPIDGIKSLIMPSITLGAAEAAVIARMTRSTILEEICKPYMVTAKSKGLRQGLIITRHVLKNAMIPIITLLGMQIGIAFGGAVVTETVFALPGLGRLAVTSILARDFPMVQGTVLVMALAFLTSNLLVDLAYGYLDPRIRYN